MGHGRNLIPISLTKTATGFDNRPGGDLMVWESLKHLY